MPTKPTKKPLRPFYSAGPCCKRPGWSLASLEKYYLAGRSHRATIAKNQIIDVAEKHRKALGIPADYKLCILGGSDTGAFEAALWSMLGPRAVDVFSWEVFSNIWTHDIVHHIKPEKGVREFVADFAHLPDFSQADPTRDIVFTWNGTTTGVRANADWISDKQEGLVMCDATSAVFCMDIPWHKLDVVSWSWQKGLGGEAQHGMLAISPKAVERLNTYKPDRAIPKALRLGLRNGKMNEPLFEKGETLNTPSMLCVAEVLDNLDWALELGLPKLLQRTADNEKVVVDFVNRTPWAQFMAANPATRSPTPHCILITDPRFQKLDGEAQRAFIKDIEKVIEKEGAGFDIAGHRDAPPNLRFGTGPTVDTADVALTMEWVDWAVTEALEKLPT